MSRLFLDLVIRSACHARGYCHHGMACLRSRMVQLFDLRMERRLLAKPQVSSQAVQKRAPGRYDDSE